MAKDALTPHGCRGSENPARCGYRIASARGGERQCRHRGRRRLAICTSRFASRTHPFFKRDGDNINIQVPLTVSEAGLGAKIEVPTIDGRALLKIPQGTQNGQKFRLREKGVFNAQKNTRGDRNCGSSLAGAGCAGRAHARVAARAGAGANRGCACGNLEQSAAVGIEVSTRQTRARAKRRT